MSGRRTSSIDKADFNLEDISWLGTPPDLSEIDIILDKPKVDVPQDFAQQFNENPETAIFNIANSMPDLADPYYLGPFLFYCPGLYPSAISKLFFSKGDQARSFFYFYFASVNLEYQSITEAARLLLSRVAFPLDPEQIATILDSFADVYLAANEYMHLTSRQIAQIAAACLTFSIFKKEKECMPFEKVPNGPEMPVFVDLIEKIEVTKDYKKSIYESIKLKPIPIFFTFGSFMKEPNFTRSGWLKKAGGGFKTKKKRWFVINHYLLQYYKDDKAKHPIGEVDLAGAYVTFVPAANKKDSEHLLMKRIDNGVIGAKIAKDGARKKSSHKEYIVYGNDSDAALLKEWCASCNMVSFWSVLMKILGQKQPSC